EHGGGIGKAGRLDDHAVERFYVAPVAASEQIAHRVDEIAANGAAQAARRHRDDVVVGTLDQQVIKADLAELVDDHRGIGEHRVLDEEIEERGLAGTEKSGEDGDRSYHRSVHMIIHGGLI